MRLNGRTKDLNPKTMRLKRGYIRVRARDDFTAMVWRDKRDVCLLPNIHDPPREGNYVSRWTRKTAFLANYDRHMGHVDNADRMVNNYTANCRTWPWIKKLFFYLLDLAIHNSYILLSSHGGKKIWPRDFRFTPIREVLVRTGYEPWPSMPVRRPAPTSTNIGNWARHNKHRPGRSPTKRRCRLCSARDMTWTEMFRCVECDVALCVDRNGFTDFHTKNNL